MQHTAQPDMDRLATAPADLAELERSAIRKAEYPRFVIQKHDATRLHYDLRLELDGVFKSWAVTRGPSLDPADKRVIRAEDLHEADYTPWEGRKMDAWPCLTVLRGKVVVESGAWKGALSDGKWQHRKIASEMLVGPML